MQQSEQEDAMGAYIWASMYYVCVKFHLCVLGKCEWYSGVVYFRGLVEMREVEGVDYEGIV